MNERLSASLTVAVFAIVVIAAGWFVFNAGSPSRHASRPDVALATSTTLAELSEKIAEMNDKLGAGSIGGPAGGAPRGPLQVEPGEIPVTRIDGGLPLEDPQAAVWSATPAVSVAVQVQNETMPMLDQATVSSVDVQALTDGRQIAWRVSWADPTADYFLDTDRFCDAVAIQFPLIANATYKMGDRDFPVQIMQWKAIWQKDIDEGFQDVQDLHPNYWADLYWFAEGKFPFRVPEAFQRTESRDYFVAYRAGNPMADLDRQQPIQELIAEGFGTLTNQPQQAAVGGGVWRDGRWSVVFGRPLTTTDGSDYQFEPGKRDVVAFAVWNGGAENVSGRKQYSQWVVFQVQP